MAGQGGTVSTKRGSWKGYVRFLPTYHILWLNDSLISATKNGALGPAIDHLQISLGLSVCVLQSVENHRKQNRREQLPGCMADTSFGSNLQDSVPALSSCGGWKGQFDLFECRLDDTEALGKRKKGWITGCFASKHKISLLLLWRFVMKLAWILAHFQQAIRMHTLLTALHISPSLAHCSLR